MALLIYNFLIYFLASIFFIPVFIYLFYQNKLKYFFFYFGYLKKKKSNSKKVLFHCVSVGEAECALKLHEKFKLDAIFTTTCPDTLSYIKKNKPDLEVLIYPLDFSFILKKILKKRKIKIVFISEIDYWPGLIKSAKNLDIPVIIINGRLSSKTLKFYKKNYFLRSLIFKNIKAVFAQNNKEKENFKKFMPACKIYVSGNLKYGNFKKIDKINKKEFIFVAGSTHWPEEKFILDILSYSNNIKIIIAPRKMKNLEKIKNDLKKRNKKVNLYSKTKLTGDIVLIDVFGVLNKLYKIADLAYIGGGFEKSGIHNFFEAAEYGVPVICGKNLKNFESEIIPFLKSRAVFKIGNIKKIPALVTYFYKHQDKLKKASSALEKIYKKNNDVRGKIINILKEDFKIVV
ncbi:MAG: 3-deoxy-D-manno-octulosonic acid transferase [Candidatus Muiribacteriota bacterium]